MNDNFTIIAALVVICLIPAGIFIFISRKKSDPIQTVIKTMLPLMNGLLLCYVFAQAVLNGDPDAERMVLFVLAPLSVIANFAILAWMNHAQKRELELYSEQCMQDIEASIQRLKEDSAARAELGRRDTEVLNNKLSTAIAQLEAVKEGTLAVEDLTPATSSGTSPEAAYGNIIAATAIRTKMAQFAENDIQLNVDAHFPVHTPLEATELSALIFNLLDNAANGTKDANGNAVSLKAQSVAGNLSVTVTNPCSEQGTKTIKPGQRTAANAKDEHGWGLSIIQHICQKHGGFCTFQTEGGVFTSTCVIPL